MINWVEKVYLVTYDPISKDETGIAAFVDLKEAEKFAEKITKDRSGIADLDTIDIGRNHDYFESYSDGKMVENGYT